MHSRLPSPRVLHQEDDPPEHLALKASGAYFWKNQNAVGNKTLHSLKGYTEAHTLRDTGQNQLFERSLGQTNFLILESLLERQEATRNHPGTEALAVAISVSSFYFKDNGASKFLCFVFPSLKFFFNFVYKF